MIEPLTRALSFIALITAPIMKGRWIMKIIGYQVYFTRSGCDEYAEFRTLGEFEEWMPRQLVVQPDTIVTKIVPVYRNSN